MKVWEKISHEYAIAAQGLYEIAKKFYLAHGECLWVVVCDYQYKLVPNAKTPYDTLERYNLDGNHMGQTQEDYILVYRLLNSEYKEGDRVMDFDARLDRELDGDSRPGDNAGEEP